MSAMPPTAMAAIMPHGVASAVTAVVTTDMPLLSTWSAMPPAMAPTPRASRPPATTATVAVKAGNCDTSCVTTSSAFCNPLTTAVAPSPMLVMSAILRSSKAATSCLTAPPNEASTMADFLAASPSLFTISSRMLENCAPMPESAFAAFAPRMSKISLNLMPLSVLVMPLVASPKSRSTSINGRMEPSTFRTLTPRAFSWPSSSARAWMMRERLVPAMLPLMPAWASVAIAAATSLKLWPAAAAEGPT